MALISSLLRDIFAFIGCVATKEMLSPVQPTLKHAVSSGARHVLGVRRRHEVMRVDSADCQSAAPPLLAVAGVSLVTE